MSGHLPLTPEILVPRLGDYLVDRGLIKIEDLQRALQKQSALRKTSSEPPLLGKLLVQMGLITQSQLDAAITEQVLQFKTALQETNRQLEQRVVERTAELETALRKLSDLNQLKANFISNISHELRTPLTHLKGYEELLASGDMGPLNQQQLNALATMGKAIDRLERLIEDLILFATSERGEMQLNLQNFNVVTVCAQLLDQFGTKAKEQQLSLFLDAAENIPSVYADWEKIGWVIHQLLDNAIKFTQAGGNITIQISQVADFVEISVQDTGIGIPESRIDELFEPFHQLDGSSTRRYGGTGLGLSLAKKILEAHETKLIVRSELGKGSQFSFKLLPALEY